MKIKHTELNIPPDQPFLNCKLDRKKYADALTSIISVYENGFVMAINNKWGSGKTTFIKMWNTELTHNLGFKSIYFNAWENDFESNSLSAILSELKSLDNDPKIFNSLLEKGSVLVKNLIPTIIKAVASKYVETKEFSEIFESISKAGTEILDAEITKYTERKRNIEDFKIELSKYVKSVSPDKPLIFFIDELDRCNPRYAVEVLEHIKHFFSVEGIVFVLSIDKKQLCNSIKGYYGSENIDAIEYLRRFIDIEYSIPEPDTKNFCGYLYEYFDFDQFFSKSDRLNHPELKEDGYSFLNFAISLFSQKDLSLRQQEKILSHARLCMLFFKSNNYVLPSVFILILYLKFFENEKYNEIKSKSLSIQDLNNTIESLTVINHKDQFSYSFVFAASQFIWMYNNYLGNYNGKLLFKKDDTDANKYVLEFESNLFVSEDRNILTSFLYLDRGRGLDINLDHFFNKIDLIESLSEN